MHSFWAGIIWNGEITFQQNGTIVLFEQVLIHPHTSTVKAYQEATVTWGISSNEWSEAFLFNSIATGVQYFNLPSELIIQFIWEHSDKDSELNFQ